jgi:cytohesin
MNYNLSLLLFLSCILLLGCGTDSNKQIQEKSEQNETDTASQASVNKEILEQLTKLREETSDLRNKMAEIQSRPVTPRVTSQSVGVVSQPVDPPERKPSELPIQMAAAIGNLARVKQLVEAGINVNTDIKGNTALHLAVSNGRDKIVHYLIEKGADPNLKNENGWMPGDFAAQYGREDLLNYLKENGAQFTPPQPLKGESKREDNDVELKVGQEREPEANSASSQANLQKSRNSKAFFAIQDRKLDALKSAIVDGFNPNKRFSPTRFPSSNYPGGILPLTIAINRGYSEIVQLLLSAGTTPVHNVKTGDIPLISAILADQANHHHGDAAAVNEDRYHQIILHLLKAAPSLASKSDGESFPLTYAARAWDEELVEVLLKAGANPNVRDGEGLTPILLAIRGSGYASISPRGIFGGRETQGHQKAVINLLLAKGADVNASSPNGENALAWAIMRRFNDLAVLLVEKGAEMNATDAGSQSIMFHLAYMGDVDLAKVMVSKGANLEAVDDSGLTLLHAAAGAGNGDFCKYLIEMGTKPNKKILRGPYSGDTPLDAAYSGSNDGKQVTIKYLKAAGAKSGRSEE